MSEKKPTKAELERAEREAACEKLREILSPGDTVYTVLNYVSHSGMQRSISLYVAKDGVNVYLTGYAARALGEKRDRFDGITVNGCGMDMGFALVYDLSHCLFPNGFGIEGKGPHGHRNTPDTKKKAAKLREKGYKFFGRNSNDSGWNNNGGYALNQKWL